MAREREVKVTILGDSKGGQRALSQLDDRADKTDAKFAGLGNKLATFGKVAALGLGAAVVGVGAFLKSSVEAAEESRKVMAQTDAVIKSTGGVARVTAADVDKLSTSLSVMSGIDDEVIAGGQNLLLTFTKVRNEVGKGNDIFNQGTKAALDMSVALGTDMNSASMLVGKALNDPIAGLTALTRSGIQFTDQQKDQIKAMVEAGDTLGAQKIILKELETQFGGSAAAAASPMERLKVVVGNLQEELGARFLPIVEKVATWLANNLPPALDAAGKGFSTLSGFVKDNEGPIKVVGALITAVLVPALITAGIQATISAAQQVTAWVVTQAKAIASAAVQVAQFVLMIGKWVLLGATAMIQAGIIAAAWLISLGPIALVIGTLILVAAAFVSNWSTIRSAVLTGVMFVVDKFLWLVETIVGAAADAFGWVPGIGPKLREAAGAVERFRDRTNEALGAIRDKTVNVYFNEHHRRYYEDIKGKAPYAGQMHTGGIVPGGRGSETLALLEGGEGVFTPEQMAVLGASMGGRGKGGGGDTYIIAPHIGALVGSDGMREFADMIQSQLLQKQRRVPTLGLT